MLIRLVSHPKGNSDHIDKLIYIEGLPESMVYRIKDGKKFLKEPWTVDTDANIPDRIQRVFFKNPVTVWFELPKDPTFQNQQNTEYSVEANCFKIDYQTRQGEEMWKSIENLLDRETPRDMDVPEPAVVGDRRDWKLEAADVPSVVLEKSVKAVDKKSSEAPPQAEPSAAESSAPIKLIKGGHRKGTSTVKCDVCGKEFKDTGIDVHKKRMHKEPVTA